MNFADVILPLPLDGVFTYVVPDMLTSQVRFGVRVVVPLGRSKTYTALVVRVHRDQPNFEVRDILGVLDDKEMLLERQYRLWQWISDYYMAPLGDIFKAALPSGLKAEDGYRPRTETYVTLAETLRHERSLHVAMDALARAEKQRKAFADFLNITHWDSLQADTPTEGITEVTREELMNVAHCTSAVIKALTERGFLCTYEREVGRLNDAGASHLDKIKLLGEAQQTAFDSVLRQFQQKNVVLLHGVTGSGKTEIYIHLIARALQEHRQVLYLLPEIALTVQIMSRLQRVFGNRLGIYHSKYSDAERVEIWRKQISDAPYDIILGARSAVFLPFQNLGLVIVDEEHETSFKQQEPAPRYHARSAAIVLAQLYGAKTLLGTATPAAETYENARQGKYGLVTLNTRFRDVAMPEIEVVDIKDLARRKMMAGPFSPQLLAAVRQSLAREQQVILFQNRRGFAPMVECRVCGWVPYCTNCDVALTLHKNMNQLTCHYCGFTYHVPAVCPNCGSTELRGRGYGTEKVEDQIRELLPEARVARMDLDTTRTRNAYARLIGDFSSGRTNVLIGTQMVSKGLDFDRVSVVGILNADALLNYPDFRANEHAFTMLAQVSGRAGRKGERGRVILQTKNPDLPLIRQVVAGDYASFYADLMDERRTFHYPPFFRLIYVVLRHTKEEVAETAAQELGSRLRQGFQDRVLGPDKPAVARVKTLHIRKIVLKFENSIDLSWVRRYLRAVQEALLHDRHYGGLQIYYDVDPL